MLKSLGQFLSWILVTVFAVSALGVLAVSLPIFSNRALIVRSGSMEPSIDVGDLVVVRPKTEPYPMGDVIAYRRSAEGKERIITHRIIAVETVEGTRRYITQGDANPDRDGEPVLPGEILGREILVVPGVGKLLAFAKTRAGLFLAIIVPCLLVLVLEIQTMMREFRRRTSVPVNETSTSVSSSSFSARNHLLPILAFAALSLMVPSTFAFFSDTGASANNAFSAATSFSTDHLVISEVQIHGGTANEDFVELYNPTGSAVLLTGWSIRKRDSAGTESSLVTIPLNGKSIPAHGFFLWSNDQGTFETDIGADVFNGNNLSENNSIALRKPDGNFADRVAWGQDSTGDQYVEGTAYVPSPGSGQSIERKAKPTSTVASMTSGGADEFKGNGFDANNNATDFILRPTSQSQNSSVTETP